MWRRRAAGGNPYSPYSDLISCMSMSITVGVLWHFSRLYDPVTYKWEAENGSYHIRFTVIQRVSLLFFVPYSLHLQSGDFRIFLECW